MPGVSLYCSQALVLKLLLVCNKLLLVCVTVNRCSSYFVSVL